MAARGEGLLALSLRGELFQAYRTAILFSARLIIIIKECRGGNRGLGAGMYEQESG
jgi:hypothetical protein